MSTFSGFFDEIPNITADCFYYANLRSKLFFLSHCHWDHMKGLTAETCLPGPLYVSAVTDVIVRKKFPNITDIRTLEIDTPYEVEYPDNDGNIQNLVVTALSAQHCPGSVIFLFETHKSTVLYTGDFRLSKQDFKKLSPLADKKIDIVYLDSTFLNEKYLHFPPQLESVKTVVNLAGEWLRMDDKRKVLIEMPANYGYEFLFMELGKRLNCKVHVDPSKWLEYIYIPEMDNYISQNELECRIFTVMKNKYHPVRCEWDSLLIMPTAFYWSSWQKGDKVYLEDKTKRTFRVSHSNHSSLTEIRDFLEFIQAREVKLNVIPFEEGEKRKMELLLEDILRRIRENNTSSTDQVLKLTEFFNPQAIFTIPRCMTTHIEDDYSIANKFKALPKRKRR